MIVSVCWRVENRVLFCNSKFVISTIYPVMRPFWCISGISFQLTRMEVEDKLVAIMLSGGAEGTVKGQSIVMHKLYVVITNYVDLKRIARTVSALYTCLSHHHPWFLWRWAHYMDLPLH